MSWLGTVRGGPLAGGRMLLVQRSQRGSAVEQDGVLADAFLQIIPDLGPFLFVPFPGDLDARDQALFFQLMENERLKKLQSHFLGQAGLVELELRSDHDDGAPRVVDALAQKVLAEADLLAAEGFAQGLERPAVRSQRPPAPR